MNHFSGKNMRKVLLTKVIYFWICFIFCILLQISCTNVHPNNYIIGVSQCSEGSWRDKLNKEMERELLLHEGVAMELRCAHDNNQTQIEDIQYFIDKKVDLLIISPFESEAITPAVTKAFEAGIPVVLFDRKVTGDKFTAYVGGDNYDVGNKLAEYIISNLPQGGKILEFMGQMDTSPAIQRHEGLKNGLKNNPEIEISASIDLHWKGEEAAAKVDSLLTLYPDTRIIAAHSDWMAWRAKERLDSIRPGNQILCIGVDGVSEEGLTAIEQGRQDASVIYPTGGDIIMRTAIDILEGKPYRREILLKSHIVSSKEDAALSNGLIRATEREVIKVQALQQRVDFYWKQNNLETALLYTLLAFLTAALGLCYVLYRSYKYKLVVNEHLKSQQITLVKQRDELLTMTHELEQATMAKLMFFTNISHDFRTPLTLIAAPIERVIQKASLGSEDNVLLKMAHRNIGVLLRLVNQILDFRKTDSGKMELHMKPANIREVISGWFESFGSLAEKKNISLVMEADDCNYISFIDVHKLERIFYNLVGNAFKYTPAGGTITVHLSRTDDIITFKVMDTGSGIDVDKIQHIFENYYQVDSANYEGTGLGLALAKSFTELHGGTIKGENQADGTGTVFTITLPVRAVQEDTEIPILQNKLNAETENLLNDEDSIQEDLTVSDEEPKPIILVIDDNADIRVFLHMLLNEKYRVLRSVNGEDGFKKAKEVIPDAIICDVMMPVMDGLECCQLLKTDAATSHIPILMLTSCSMDEQRVQGLERGADVYLAKPFNSSVLLAQLESLLKNHIRVKDFYSKTPLKTISVSEPDTKAKKESPRLSKYDEEFLQKLRQLVELHISDENYTVERLASDICLSRTQLFRKSKALTGESPVELLRNARLLKARDLFEAGEGPIAAVALKVGFTDPSYFTKCYKSRFGSTPSDRMK